MSNSGSTATLSNHTIPSSDFGETRLQRSQSLNLYENTNNSNTKSMAKTSSGRTRKSCQMCFNYELQLQSMQKKESSLMKQILSRKDDLQRGEKFRAELEDKFNEEAKNIEQEILLLQKRIESSSTEIIELRNLLSSYQTEANRNIKTLTDSNQNIHLQLQKLLAENELLLGKHLQKSQEVDAEEINLPENLDDMQFYCLKLKEDLITTLVSKERAEEKYRSELAFLKDQQRSEQQSKEAIIQDLTEETENLRQHLENTRTRYKRLKKERDDAIKRLSETEFSLQENQQTILKLQQEVTQLSSQKLALDQETSTLKASVLALQAGLENSEQVQKDFVKLSQNLQIELEKIRQADTEVRWQHEEDVFECNNCKKNLHSRKEKHHCCHCGKIFCSDCNSKTIEGGPKKRPFKVCNVCHTLLNRETAPYFSNELPQSPT